MNLNKKGYEIVAEDLKTLIDSGALTPGCKLDTNENLARKYNVSRSTIREALSILKAQGLVTSVQGDGTYVSSTAFLTEEFLKIFNTNVELVNLLQFRMIFEVGCIELATKFRTEDDIKELSRIVRQMENVIGNEEMSQVYDVNFHLAIARATHNTLFENIMENISSVMIRTMRLSRTLWLYSQKESSEALVQEHNQMLEAIISGNSNAAGEVMKKHLETVERVLNGSAYGAT